MAGDPRSVRAVSDYRRLIEPLLGRGAALAMSILHDRSDADDAVQEAALRGLQRWSTYDPGRPFAGWWLTIVRHCCIDLLRGRCAAREVPLGEHEPAAPAEPRPDVETWKKLSLAIGQLPEQHRDILRLRYFGQCSYREIAEVLGIPEGTVMSRLHYARKTLADQIGSEEP